MDNGIDGNQAERDEKGRFKKGNKISPGRAPVAREVRYYDILKTTVTFSDWEDIVKRAVTDAKRGDGVARKWLADYLIGPPVERKDITSKGEKLEQNIIVVRGVDYRSSIANLAPGSVEDSDTPGEDQSIIDGPEMG